MAAPLVLYISPMPALRSEQRGELTRLLRGDFESISVSPIGFSVPDFVAMVRDHDANVVIAGGGPDLLAALTALASDRVLLYPLRPERRTRHGLQGAFHSYGRLRADGSVEPLPDGALQSTP